MMRSGEDLLAEWIDIEDWDGLIHRRGCCGLSGHGSAFRHVVSCVVVRVISYAATSEVEYQLFSSCAGDAGEHARSGCTLVIIEDRVTVVDLSGADADFAGAAHPARA